MGIKEIYMGENSVILPDEFVFTDLSEVPLDEYLFDYPDGNNSLLENFPGGLPVTEMERVVSAQRNAEANLRLALNRKVVVPLPRELRYKQPYMAGKDVLALQRALARAGLRKWGNFTMFYGKGTKYGVAEFQEKVHLKRDGVYGKETHAKLAKYYDAYGAFLMNEVNKQFAETPRNKIIAYATFGYNNRHKIHYTQSSLRMYGVRKEIKPPKIPFYEDCSSYSTWCYWGANVSDPNGLGYNGFGYTGTLSLHGATTMAPRPGDLAFYGHRPYSHVVIYIGNNRCISHGSEMGPILLPVYYRSDFSHFRKYIK